MTSHGEFSKILISFFDQSDEDFTLRTSNSNQKPLNPTFLLCFDNCEDLLSNETEAKEFVELIHKLWKNCSQLRIMLSTNMYNKLPTHVANEIVELKTIQIEPLTTSEAANFF